LIASGKDRDTMGNNINERWLSRQELADRFGLPVKTLAQWASKGTGPPFARMGRHVRYRLSDVIDWEAERVDLRDAAQRRVSTPRAVVPITDVGSKATNAVSVRDER
jgi:predicted DNA-binding transcriptional regulator AlpA